jgi:hypothetical protein
MSLYDKASLVQIPSGTKDGTLYSVLPANGDGDFTHVRATSATRVNKDGLIESVASGVPRLDYPLLDGVVQSCPALLLEPSRTNYLLYSEDFSDWTDAFSDVTENQIVSPDGNATADKVQNSGASSFGRVEITLSLTSGSNIFYSVFVKKNDYDTITIRIDGTNVGGSGNSNATYDFVYSTETISRRTGGTATSTLVEDFGNGWYRIGIELTNSTVTKATIYPSYGNTQTNSHYVWGAQLEQGDYPTSYIPTTTFSVTRNADECNSAGTTAEFNDSEGVLFAELKGLNETDSSTGYIVLNDGSTTTNAIFIQYRNTGELRLYNGGTSTPELIYRDASADLTENIKLAIKYGTTTGSYKIYINGFSQTLQGSFVATSMSGLSKLQFAYSNGTSNPFRGKAKQLMTFNEALTDSELEQVTSWTSFGEMAKGQLYTIE